MEGATDYRNSCRQSLLHNLNRPTVPSYKVHIVIRYLVSYAFKVLNVSTELNLSKTQSFDHGQPRRERLRCIL